MGIGVGIGIIIRIRASVSSGISVIIRISIGICASVISRVVIGVSVGVRVVSSAIDSTCSSCGNLASSICSKSLARNHQTAQYQADMSRKSHISPLCGMLNKPLPN